LGSLNVTIEASERYHGEALALSENLVRERPENSVYRAALANACNQMALLRGKQNRLTEGTELFRRAMKLREEILLSQPDDPVVRANIAETCVNSSQFAYRCGDRANGKQLHDRAEAEFKQLIRANPQDFGARTGLAALRINWAYVLGAENNTAAAEAELTANIQDMGMLLEQEPESAVVRDRLFRSYGLRAEIYTGHKQYVEALYDTQKAVEMATPEGRDFYRLFLAMAYARAGKHAQAIEETRALAGQMTAKTPFAQRVHLASVCGIAAKGAEQDSAMSESARSVAAASYVSLGLEQMREARCTVTYMEWLLQIPEFLSNADLAPLRAAPKWLELFKP
jgi:tetratricopeptide (TPR) repeat protein